MKLLRVLLPLLALSSSLSAVDQNDVNNIAKSYVIKADEYKQNKNMKKALEYYKNAIALNPNDFMLIFNTANELYNEGLNEEAITYYDRALKLRNDVEQVYFNKGIVFTQLNKHAEAADCFMQAINTNRNYDRAYVHAGNAFEKCDKHAEAIAIYKRGLEIDNNNADLHFRLGSVYKHKDMFEEAINELRIATEKNRENLVYKLELANTLHLIDGSEEAAKLYQTILEQNPKNHHVLYNLGYTVKKMGYIDEALEIYNKVLEMEPDYALARFSRSLIYLILGDWKHGWQEYEWRWAAYDESPKKFDAPVWDGSDIRGKRILLYAEQGLGDTIQFIRYAELVKDLGAYVIVETQDAVKDILKLCPYIDEVYSRGERLPHFDTQIAMMSLPLVFDTQIETTPHNVPYIFAKPELVAYWADQLKDDHNFKIGICWQGNPNYRTQFLRQAVAGKSMHVKNFEPIARLRGVSLYNLQKMGGESQLQELAPDVEIKSFGSDFDKEHGRFMDTMAVMKNLDLIITIDTGTCHVAAALGVPTWNLLPNPADWRWMIDRNDTPWYNNMRLFKQPSPGDWQGAIEECVKALEPILRGQKTVQEVTLEKGKIEEIRPYENRKRSNKETTNRSVSTQVITQTEPTLRTLNKNIFTFESLQKEASGKEATTKDQQKTPDQGPIANKTKQLQHEKIVQKIIDESPEIKEALNQRNNHMSRHEITTQLIAINKQLAEYEHRVKALEPSIFNDEYMELMEKVLELNKQKKELKVHAKVSRK
jgi:tetratricopeptide (TPR) repeat protein